MPTPRIYADFNGLIGSFKTADRSAVVLDAFGTLRELANAGIVLSNGMRLVVYDWSDDEEDLEADAAAFFDFRRNWWVAEFDDPGLRYIPKKYRDHSNELHCWSCRKLLPDSIRTKHLWVHARCPHCDSEICKPIMRPVN
jgi:hypothetical protein